MDANCNGGGTDLSNVPGVVADTIGKCYDTYAVWSYQGYC
jgi:hypothetical protein